MNINLTHIIQTVCIYFQTLAGLIVTQFNSVTDRQIMCREKHTKQQTSPADSW